MSTVEELKEISSKRYAVQDILDRAKPNELQEGFLKAINDAMLVNSVCPEADAIYTLEELEDAINGIDGGDGSKEDNEVKLPILKGLREQLNSYICSNILYTRLLNYSNVKISLLCLAVLSNIADRPGVSVMIAYLVHYKARRTKLVYINLHLLCTRIITGYVPSLDEFNAAWSAQKRTNVTLWDNWLDNKEFWTV